jgi:hypothetical protein
MVGQTARQDAAEFVDGRERRLRKLLSTYIFESLLLYLLILILLIENGALMAYTVISELSMFAMRRERRL